MHYRFAPDQTPPTNPFPPHPEQSLYFYPKDRVTCNDPENSFVGTTPSSMLVGPKLYRVDLQMGHDTVVVIVNFHPGGLHRLLRIPMDEMFGNNVDATLLLGRETDIVTEQLRETADYDRMNEIVQQYLNKKAGLIKESLPVEQVLMRLLDPKHTLCLNVDHLSRLAFVSVRQLERQFRERVGMPPKLFFKLVRFSRAWIMRERNPRSSWLHIAHACDFSDQMHMIRDFKYFTGATPGSLQQELENTPLRLQATSL